MAALALLDRESGPVLVDYPEDVPEGSDAVGEDEMTGMVCPIDLPRIPDADAPASELGRTLLAEMDSLAPWYDLAVRTRGRTTVGPSGLGIKDAAKFVSAFLEDQEAPAPRDDLLKGRVLKLAYEDIRLTARKRSPRSPVTGRAFGLRIGCSTRPSLARRCGPCAVSVARATTSTTNISAATRSCRTVRLI